ncbi:nucleoside hydrolase [Rathayibacter sp. Leaf296]|uniref:nucleoside hydrolase n=1 Tax=Rathayibacter sp. Leaf296 TaxID=1736327 RepID=UPI000703B445|nr:nucleoside hydrolase [Rathayibacter sp. Leaf296]KQQ08172.1 nucleoside hydrolase [Rathayibacter sp. Leaf296]
MIPLLIDTDTAADDCFALLIGLLDPRADLRAVTMVAGNVGFDQQLHNAFLTIALAGRAGEVPVHLGARTPLLRPWVSATEVHGDGVGGIRRPEDSQRPEEEHAVDALIRLAAEHAGRLRIVAIGPLTNIALAARKDPSFVRNVERLTVMAGSLNGRGNITPAAEFNVYVDPEAAAIVTGAGFADLRFVTWDPLTLRDAVFDEGRIAEIAAAATPLSDFFVRANRATFDFDVRVGIDGSTHPDSLSVLLSLDEDLVLEERAYSVAVETDGRLTLGATVFDWTCTPETANATAVERIDGERFFAYVRDLMATTPPTPPEVRAAISA